MYSPRLETFLRVAEAGILKKAAAITEFRTEVFTGCGNHNSCRENPGYLDRARKIAVWAAE